MLTSAHPSVFMDMILWPVNPSDLCIVKIVSVMQFSYQKLMTLSYDYDSHLLALF